MEQIDSLPSFHIILKIAPFAGSATYFSHFRYLTPIRKHWRTIQEMAFTYNRLFLLTRWDMEF